MNVADHRAPLHRRVLDRRAIRITAVALAVSMAPIAFSSPAVAADSPAVSMTGLSMGARGNAVTALQEALIRHGFTVAGGADGIFGPATAAALRQFQTSQGLPASGVVDDATTRALGLSPVATPAPVARTVAASEFVGLSQGIVGPRVRMLQQALIAAGVPAVGGTDGVFGPMTTSAVSRYQTANGLSATGVVDAATAAILTGSPVPAGSIEIQVSASNTPQAAPTASPMAGLIGLGIGNMGTKVTQVQQALLAAGIRLPGGADGNFGPATASALNQFQTRNGLPVTGRVDEATALALATPTGAPVNSPAAPVTTTASRVTTATAGLAPGAVGGAVKALQDALVAAGIRVPGGADGIFGPATANAVKAFQTARGLPATGRVDPATAAALATPASAQPTTPAPAPSTPTVGFASFGERGDRVRALQQALLAAGVAVPGGADGIFGSQTAGSIMNFQRQQSLPVTGTLDETTAGRLGLTPAGAPVAPTTGSSITLGAFPVQGRCHFGDTWGFPRGGGRKHEGVDIIAPEGKLIYAVTDGTVTHVYHDRPGSLAGNGLRLTQPDGTYFFYAHLSAFEEGIAVGTRVRAGQVLGYNGSTGNAGTPHLHFEIHPGGGAAINPFPFVKAVDACNRTEPLAQS
jgi:peptidoglycan hydrolase-like protein with peptidoglycan-binding domain